MASNVQSNRDQYRSVGRVIVIRAQGINRADAVVVLLCMYAMQWIEHARVCTCAYGIGT